MCFPAVLLRFWPWRKRVFWITKFGLFRFSRSYFRSPCCQPQNALSFLPLRPRLPASSSAPLVLQSRTLSMSSGLETSLEKDFCIYSSSAQLCSDCSRLNHNFSPLKTFYKSRKKDYNSFLRTCHLFSISALNFLCYSLELVSSCSIHCRGRG